MLLWLMVFLKFGASRAAHWKMFAVCEGRRRPFINMVFNDLSTSLLTVLCVRYLWLVKPVLRVTSKECQQENITKDEIHV